MTCVTRKGATKAKWKLERCPQASSALKVLAEGLGTGCFSGTCLAEVGGQVPSSLELLWKLDSGA